MEEMSNMLPNNIMYPIALCTVFLHVIWKPELTPDGPELVPNEAHDDRFIILQSPGNCRATAVGVRNQLYDGRNTKSKRADS